MYYLLFLYLRTKITDCNMVDKIIGRKVEQEILRQRVESNNPELIAIYGRRRICKTFLVRQYFKDTFNFYSTGIYQGTKREQLGEFNRQLEYYSKRKWKLPKDWFDAFAQLREYMMSLGGNKPIVVFLDELPWMDTPKSRFIKAFENFWNSYGATNNRLKFIVCGSATTWMSENVLSDKGGLYNRTTRSIYLAPFTLHETEKYLYLVLRSNGLYIYILGESVFVIVFCGNVEVS